MTTKALEKRIEELERRVMDLESTCLRLVREPKWKPYLPPVVGKTIPPNNGNPMVWPSIVIDGVTFQ